MKILLAIDGSGRGDAAVDEIARQHTPADSEVRVLSVVESSYFSAGLPGEGANWALYAEVETAARERARAAVEKAAAKLRVRDGENHQLSVTTEDLVGSPKREILDEADKFGADLIVVASHGHGDFERFLLGSVSQAVALHAKCSVEIVRSRKALAKE